MASNLSFTHHVTQSCFFMTLTQNDFSHHQCDNERRLNEGQRLRRRHPAPEEVDAEGTEDQNSFWESALGELEGEGDHEIGPPFDFDLGPLEPSHASGS